MSSLPIIWIPQLLGEPRKPPFSAYDSLSDKILCFDPSVFPSTLTAAINVYHRACTWTIKVIPGAMVDFSIVAPNTISANFTLTPNEALLTGTTYRPPVSNCCLSSTMDDGTIISTTMSRSTAYPVWQDPAIGTNYYTNPTMTSVVLASGKTFTTTTSSWKMVCHDCVLTLRFGFGTMYGENVKSPIFFSFRRNASATSDITAIKRVWEGRLHCEWVWSGSWDYYIGTEGNWTLSSSGTLPLPANESSVVFYTDSSYILTCLSSDPANLNVLGTYLYQSGRTGGRSSSSNNPSYGIGDLARNDVFSITAKT